MFLISVVSLLALFSLQKRQLIPGPLEGPVVYTLHCFWVWVLAFLRCQLGAEDPLGSGGSLPAIPLFSRRHSFVAAVSSPVFFSLVG